MTEDSQVPADGGLGLESAREAWSAGTGGRPGEIVWHADPGELEAGLKCFVGSSGQALAVLHSGCGPGRQARSLARHLIYVAGVDVSAARWQNSWGHRYTARLAARSFKQEAASND